MTIDTLKQAAQALRTLNRADSYTNIEALAAALEAMAEQKPVAWRYTDACGKYRYRGPSETFAQEYKILKPFPLYAAPIATPEHDAKVRDAALEEAAQLCERLGHGLDNGNRPYVRHHEVVQAMHRIRKLKSTGADHAK